MGGGGGFWARILRRGGGFRVQVRGNFHILISKKKNSEGGFKPPKPPPSGSATGNCIIIVIELYCNTFSHYLIHLETDKIAFNTQLWRTTI